MGQYIAVEIFKMAATNWLTSVVAFAINMVISTVISSVFAPNNPQAQSQPNPGNRQQLPPAGDNKLPVVYGTAYVGGMGVDLSITSGNQDIYWVFALCEVTGTENGGTGDAITFGYVYWGGKRCIFDTTNKYKVTGLLDESNGNIQDVSGYMEIFLYSKGSQAPWNSTFNAYSTDVMGNTNLIYTWDSTKQMTNTAFAVIHTKYSVSRNLTGLQQTRFQIINSRSAPGDCIYDYLTSVRYGAAIPTGQIDTTSTSALNTYSNQTIVYKGFDGFNNTQKRYVFNGVLDTQQKIMQNIQSMADSCNCLIKYNEITSLWGVIVQQPTYTVAMNINDSNLIGGITVSPLDISSSFNVIEAKFPDGTSKDNFNSATLDLAKLRPELLYPNEPVNKQSVNLYLVNNSVQASYLANIYLEAGREDLQIQCEINYYGLQLEAGDIVTVTNTNYGWSAKLFRLSKVIEKISDAGQVTATLSLSEFNPAVYDDKSVTEFTPSPNSGIPSPSVFATVPAPTVNTLYPAIANPAFGVTATTPSAGIIDYAEIWYSAYPNSDLLANQSQLIFAGTTEINPAGNSYPTNTAMPTVTLFNIPAGNWYFYSRMVNSLASSAYSSASIVVNWRPQTFQYTERYLTVAYADTITGGGFDLNPRTKSYYGLDNSSSITPSTNPADYNWYLADPLFGSAVYLAYANRSNRKFSFATDFAGYAGGTGAFVPASTTTYDPRLWSALQDGTNYIDLDHSTGQVLQTGNTSAGAGAGQLLVSNTPDGQVVASLDQFLNFGGDPTYTVPTVGSLTIDIYGRVVGFTPPDSFYYSIENFVATSGQTVFTPTARQSGYISGSDLIFQNGMLLDLTEYTETTTTFTLNTGATVGDQISVISTRAVSGSDFYETLNLTYASGTGTATITYAGSPWQNIDVGDIITFANTGTPTQYTVSSVNYTSKTITFTGSTTALTAGATIYRFRASGSSYRTFSRFDVDLVAQSSYTPTLWAFDSGFEMPFINGGLVASPDYNLVAGAITNFPNSVTGKLTTIQWNQNNLGQPVTGLNNIIIYTSTGVTLYSLTYNPLAFNLFANGVYLIQGSDYTTAIGNYTLSYTPNNSTTVLQQQTYSRTGAA
jgi:hypothetical protein